MANDNKTSAERIVHYTDKDGKVKKIKYTSAIKYPKDHPAFKAAEKWMRRDKSEQPSVSKDELEVDPAVNDFVASLKPKDLPPVPKSPTNYDGPKNDSDSVGKLDGSAKVERRIVTLLNKLADVSARAKERGEKAPNYDLCQISIPGTNMFCDGNLGIPRSKMPQLKGTPEKGSIAYKLAKEGKLEATYNKDGSIKDVDTEPLFIKALQKKGYKIEPKRQSADNLRATQDQLVGAKVAGIMKALENEPDNKRIRAPIFVSRDGYILDGHHRWAAVVGLQLAGGSGEDIMMDTIVVDVDAKDLVNFTNAFSKAVGIEQEDAKT